MMQLFQVAYILLSQSKLLYKKNKKFFNFFWKEEINENNSWKT